MLKCLFISRKLYDYLEKNLSEMENIKVQKHLDSCMSCQGKLNQIAHLLELTKGKDLPVPDDDFWHNFQIDLDAKLNRKLTGKLIFRPTPKYNFKPVISFVTLSLFLLIVFSGYFHNRYSQNKVALNKNLDSELVDEANLLYELSDGQESNGSESDLIEDIDILFLEEDGPA